MRVCNEVLAAERIGAERVREISDTPPRTVTGADRRAKNRAYVEATFGEVRGGEENEDHPETRAAHRSENRPQFERP